MSTTISVPVLRPSFSADRALGLSAGLWFAVAFLGQMMFAVSTALFYGMPALRGDLLAWNKRLAHGYIVGDPAGNAALVAHIVCAVLLIISGTIQFVPAVRRRAPAFHRWNGRIYIFSATCVALAGMYLLVMRGTGLGLTQEIGTFVLAVLMLLCAAMALRTAMRRDFATHRRWAWRLYLLVASSLFIRSSLSLSAMIVAGTGVFDLSVLRGSLLVFLTFAQYVVPLEVLELYFWTQRHGLRAARLAMAAVLLAITVLTGAGVAAASVAVFAPAVRIAFDRRPPISAALAATIAKSGVDAAVAQYRALRAAPNKVYNFDETELNTLGYALIREKNFAGAIRILTLNAEVYPKSSNTWDSLAEAYMDNGDIDEAVANYHKSLALNPRNQNARAMLAKMGRA